MFKSSSRIRIIAVSLVAILAFSFLFPGENLFFANNLCTGNLVTGPTEWSKTYGGTDGSNGKSIVKTIDGGYAIAGDAYTSVAGVRDFYLFKTDSAGNMLWSKTYGGKGDDSVSSLVQTNDGGYAIVGDTNSFGAGGYDVYLVKTDSAGNMQWNKTYGTNYPDHGLSVVQTSDGGFAILRRQEDFAAFWNADVYLVKTDSAGNIQWNKTYVPNLSLKSLVQTSDGGYAMAGDADGNVWLVKTDSAGTFMWNNMYKGKGSELGDSVVQTSDGGYAIAGATYPIVNSGMIDTSLADVLLVKTDSAGTMQWLKTYGGKYEDVGYSVVQASDDGFAIAGYRNLAEDETYYVYLVKTDSAGDMQWSNTYGGTNTDTGRSVVQASDGEFVIAGMTDSFSSGKTDAYLVKTSTENSSQTITPSPSIQDLLTWIILIVATIIILAVVIAVKMRKSKRNTKVAQSDEKSPLPQITSHLKRPTGIIIVSVFWIIGGLYNIYNGLNIVDPGKSSLYQIGFTGRLGEWWSWAQPIDMVIASVAILLGLLQLVTVPGLLMGKRWSYYAGLSIPIMAFVLVGSQTLLIMTAPLDFNELLAALPLLLLFGNLAFMLIYVAYLRQPNVRVWLGVKNKLAESLKKVNDTTSSSEPLPENDTVIMQESNVKQFDSESPPSIGLSVGPLGRNLELGTLILTNKKLIYVSMDAWGAMALTKTVSQAQVNYLMKYKKSYFVPLQEITQVESSHFFSQQYLRVNNCCSGQKNHHSYLFTVPWQRDAYGATIPKSQYWVNAINSAIKTARYSQMIPPTNYSSTETQPNQIPPTLPKSETSTGPKCPLCGAPLIYVQVHKQWYCFNEKQYFPNPVCPNCQKPLPEGNPQFCIYCGQSLKS